MKWLSIFTSYRNLLAHVGLKEKGLNHKEVKTCQYIYKYFGMS
jgi:hypothetical protein